MATHAAIAALECNRFIVSPQEKIVTASEHTRTRFAGAICPRRRRQPERAGARPLRATPVSAEQARPDELAAFLRGEIRRRSAGAGAAGRKSRTVLAESLGSH
jgi:hypothetical protein